MVGARSNRQIRSRDNLHARRPAPQRQLESEAPSWEFSGPRHRHVRMKSRRRLYEPGELVLPSGGTTGRVHARCRNWRGVIRLEVRIGSELLARNCQGVDSCAPPGVGAELAARRRTGLPAQVPASWQRQAHWEGRVSASIGLTRHAHANKMIVRPGRANGDVPSSIRGWYELDP
jgi:hypothetical protein